MGKSKHAPSTIEARDREAEAVRLRAEGYSFHEIGVRLGVARQSAWRMVDRAMERQAGALSDGVGRLRAMEAERLDAAARAVMPAVLDGDLRAQDVWLRNRTRYATLLGLDARSSAAPSSTEQQVVVVNTAVPWMNGGAATALPPATSDLVLTPPDPESLIEPPFG